ncbi:MAG: hypothetical protein PVG41_10635 [Desulfobacteraceae bacterium]|jgi:hypothetical protein
MRIMMRMMLTTLSIAALCAGSVLAGNVTIPHDFAAGTPAVADHVDANFNAVRKEVNDNNTRISANTTNKQNRVSDTCPTGQAIRVIKEDGTVTCQADTNSGGDITAVIAGNFLSGGANSGPATLNVVGMPGIDWSQNTTTISLTTTDTVLAQRTITAPMSGWILAIFSGFAEFTHTNGTNQSIQVWMNTDGSSTRAGASWRFFYADDILPSGFYYNNVASVQVFTVSSAGSITIYAVGDSSEPSGSSRTRLYHRSLNLLFFPTSY